MNLASTLRCGRMTANRRGFPVANFRRPILSSVFGIWQVARPKLLIRDAAPQIVELPKPA